MWWSWAKGFGLWKRHYHQCSENFPNLGEIFKITNKNCSAIWSKILLYQFGASFDNSTYHWCNSTVLPVDEYLSHVNCALYFVHFQLFPPFQIASQNAAYTMPIPKLSAVIYIVYILYDCVIYVETKCFSYERLYEKVFRTWLLHNVALD